MGSVDRNIAAVHKTHIAPRGKGTPQSCRMPFLCGSNSHESIWVAIFGMSKILLTTPGFMVAGGKVYICFYRPHSVFSISIKNSIYNIVKKNLCWRIILKEENKPKQLISLPNELYDMVLIHIHLRLRVLMNPENIKKKKQVHTGGMATERRYFSCI